MTVRAPARRAPPPARARRLLAVPCARCRSSTAVVRGVRRLDGLVPRGRLRPATRVPCGPRWRRPCPGRRHRTSVGAGAVHLDDVVVKVGRLVDATVPHCTRGRKPCSCYDTVRNCTAELARSTSTPTGSTRPRPRRRADPARRRRRVWLDRPAPALGVATPWADELAIEARTRTTLCPRRSSTAPARRGDPRVRRVGRRDAARRPDARPRPGRRRPLVRAPGCSTGARAALDPPPRRAAA